MPQRAELPEDIIFNFLIQQKAAAAKLPLPVGKRNKLLDLLDELISLYKDVNE